MCMMAQHFVRITHFLYWTFQLKFVCLKSKFIWVDLESLLIFLDSLRLWSAHLNRVFICLCSEKGVFFNQNVTDSRVQGFTKETNLQNLFEKLLNTTMQRNQPLYISKEMCNLRKTFSRVLPTSQTNSGNGHNFRGRRLGRSMFFLLKKHDLGHRHQSTVVQIKNDNIIRTYPHVTGFIHIWTSHF